MIETIKEKDHKAMKVLIRKIKRVKEKSLEMIGKKPTTTKGKVVMEIVIIIKKGIKADLAAKTTIETTITEEAVAPEIESIQIVVARTTKDARVAKDLTLDTEAAKDQSIKEVGPGKTTIKEAKAETEIVIILSIKRAEAKSVIIVEIAVRITIVNEGTGVKAKIVITTATTTINQNHGIITTIIILRKDKITHEVNKIKTKILTKQLEEIQKEVAQGIELIKIEMSIIEIELIEVGTKI